MPIRVILADDHPVVRSGIRMLLQRAPDIQIIGEASKGRETLRLVGELVPDVLVLDMELPEMTGVEIARTLHAQLSPVRIIALSAYDDEQYIFGLLASGASGYLTKDEATEVIVDAVRGVAGGEIGWLSRRIAAKVMTRKMPWSMPSEKSLQLLSLREREVLKLVSRGCANEDVAQQLSISQGTVKNHLTNIYGKLMLRTRAEAVAWAWKHGIMDDLAGT